MSKRKKGHKPTRLFWIYVTNLIVRFGIFLYAVFLLITSPESLDPITNFNLDNGITFIDVVFILMACDAGTKLFPHMKIAIGSLKQYKTAHIPTPEMLRDKPEEIRAKLQSVLSSGIDVLTETRDGVKSSGEYLASEIEAFLKKTRKIKAEKSIRSEIRHNRLHEIIPVIIFWIIANVSVALILFALGWLSPSVLVIWSLFYFVFDMICVVLWCPLQLLFMKNRCCTTCHIFNWDAAMTTTPLVMVLCPFSIVLIALSLIVLLRWELAVARHPERFDERTNAKLRCRNCTDKLCYLRKPLLINNIDKKVPKIPVVSNGVEVEFVGEDGENNNDIAQHD